MGDITGYSNDCSSPIGATGTPTYAFETQEGVLYRLASPSPSTRVLPVAISANGDVVANGYDSVTGKTLTFVYYPDRLESAALLPFSAVGGQVWATTQAHAAGTLPTFVGAELVAETNTRQWISYTLPSPGSTSQVAVIPAPATGFAGDGAAFGTSEHGELVGYYTSTGGQRVAVIARTAGSLQNLNDLIDPATGWSLEVAFAVNDSRQVIGLGRHNATASAFLMDLQSGHVAELGTLGSTFTALQYNATAINAFGHVVGTAGVPVGASDYRLDAQRAFVYTRALGMVDLNTLVPMPAGWVFASAMGINDNDEVAGFAISTMTSARRAFKVKLPSLPSRECQTAEDGAPCNDDDACTTADKCESHLCVGGTRQSCPSTNACWLAGSCDAVSGACSYPIAADGTACNDWNACTQTDRCVSGQCIGSDPVTCPAATTCASQGVCQSDSGQCTSPNALDGTPCDDDDPCTLGDSCRAGACVATEADATCMADSVIEPYSSIAFPTLPLATDGLAGVSGDIDKDRKSDILLIGGVGAPAMPSGRSNGDGTFASLGVGLGLLSRPGAKVVTGDFDGDGRTDVASIGGFNHGVIDIAFSNGDGTYRIVTQNSGTNAAFAAEAGRPGIQAVTVDLNADGRTDIVLLGGVGTAGLDTALSEGDGSFYVRTHLLASFNGLAAQPGVKVARVNRGIALFGGVGWQSIPFMWTDERGYFHVEAPTIADNMSSAMSAFHAYAHKVTTRVVVGDFDRNGFSDVALVGPTPPPGARMPIALQFAPFDNRLFQIGTWNVTTTDIDLSQAMKTPGTTPVSGDFNGDGAADIALVGGAGRSTTIVASGHYVDRTPCPSGELCIPPQPFAFTEQERLDAIAPLVGAPTARVVTDTDSNRRRAAPSMDQDGDRRGDLVLSGAAGWSTVPIAYSDGNGHFHTTNSVASDFAAAAAATGSLLLSGDFDGDGRADVALLRDGNTTPVMYAYANGNGTFQVVATVDPHFPVVKLDSSHYFTGDFNGDGRFDIARVGGHNIDGTNDNSIQIEYSNGRNVGPSATYNKCPLDHHLAEVANAGAAVLAADVNGDGADDIVLIDSQDVLSYLGAQIGDPESTCGFKFSPLHAPSSLSRSYSSNVKPVVGDFNGDGLSDIAVIGADANSAIPIGMSLGDGTFNAISVNAPGFASWSEDTHDVEPVSGDFDGDGVSDLALVHTQGQEIPVAFAPASGEIGASDDNGGQQGFQITNDNVSDFAADSHSLGAIVATTSAPEEADLTPPPPAMIPTQKVAAPPAQQEKIGSDIIIFGNNVDLYGLPNGQPYSWAGLVSIQQGQFMWDHLGTLKWTECNIGDETECAVSPVLKLTKMTPYEVVVVDGIEDPVVDEDSGYHAPPTTSECTPHTGDPDVDNVDQIHPKKSIEMPAGSCVPWASWALSDLGVGFGRIVVEFRADVDKPVTNTMIIYCDPVLADGPNGIGCVLDQK